MVGLQQKDNTVFLILSIRKYRSEPMWVKAGKRGSGKGERPVVERRDGFCEWQGGPGSRVGYSYRGIDKCLKK